ncbi:MAG: helix-turn-helix domain-containing protein [Actinomycetota bacterium]|nr:helix-turn-helix domain-containing protein [Actinomycetota bacterium]
MERGAAKFTDFGRRLRELRESAGLSQEELAARAGLTAKGIGALERGERRYPQPHTLRSLADALNLSDASRSAFFATVPKRAGGALSPSEARVDTSALPAPLPAAPPTPLLGRERDVAMVLSLLEKGEARLLSLTGPGGVGKTRLALEVAVNAEDMFNDGVAFVGLAPLNDADLVLPTLFRTLGLNEIGGRSVGETLREHLKGRRMLLVLDNFEHVMEAASEVAGLLSACPDLVMLATSRTTLRVRGEKEYPVQPLAVPDPSRSPDMRVVNASPAARLFANRASEANPYFEITVTNAASVAAICWRLDGLPLALELAAAKTRYLGPTELLSRLDRALEAGGARDLPERQRTMRATLNWSHNLLSNEEKALFRYLSVFAGGFGMEAVEAVGGTYDVLGLLGSLVEQSLVAAEPDAPGGTRYRMLEPIRQYALERLHESAEEEEARRRHAEHYLAFAEQVGPKLTGAQMVEWLDRLEAERDNLRAAVSWALPTGRGELAVRLAYELRRFFWSRGQHEEVCRWMEEALTDDAATPGTRARATYVLQLMRYRLGEEELVWAPKDAAAILRTAGDVVGAADALILAGVASLRTGDAEQAMRLLQESHSLYESVGDEQGCAQAFVFLGGIPLGRGEVERAEEYFERGLQQARRSGNPLSMYVALYHMALAAQGKGEYVRAGRYYAKALMVGKQTKDRSHVALSIVGLAECSATQGDPGRAARLFGAADAVFRSVGMSFHPLHASASFHKRHLDLMREELDPKTYEAARAEGLAMTFEEAVAYALEDDEASPA